MPLAKEIIQRRAESHVKRDPYRVVLCCKALEGLTLHDLMTLIPSHDIWAEELERQIDAGEGGDFPDSGNIRLEQIVHLIEALNALVKI
jgi:hypothetical protein